MIKMMMAMMVMMMMMMMKTKAVCERLRCVGNSRLVTVTSSHSCIFHTGAPLLHCSVSYSITYRSHIALRSRFLFTHCCIGSSRTLNTPIQI